MKKMNDIENSENEYQNKSKKVSDSNHLDAHRTAGHRFVKSGRGRYLDAENGHADGKNEVIRQHGGWEDLCYWWIVKYGWCRSFHR